MPQTAQLLFLARWAMAGSPFLQAAPVETRAVDVRVGR